MYLSLPTLCSFLRLLDFAAVDCQSYCCCRNLPVAVGDLSYLPGSSTESSSRSVVVASADVVVASADAAAPKTDKIICVSPLVLVVAQPCPMPDSSSSSP